jgi:pyridoxine 4-dehydrogenase
VLALIPTCNVLLIRCLLSRPIETTIGTLSQLVKEGKFDHIGLSEVSASSIRRATKIHPIAAVEIEYSLWSTEAKDNGVLETTKELGIPIIAYSPLGRGILAGKWKTWEDVPILLRERIPRYSAENFEHNSQFLHIIERIAERKGVTPAQVAIKWVLTVGDHVIPIPGATTVERVKENTGAANVDLTDDELQELNRFTEETEVRGQRYGGGQVKFLFA